MRRLLATLCAVLLCGGHLGVLQGVAWLGMLQDRLSAGQAVGQAVSETFDGAHPCTVCLAVQDLQQQDQAPAAPADKTLKKADKALTCAWSCPLPVVGEWSVAPAGEPFWHGFAADVETPPPRV